MALPELDPDQELLLDALRQAGLHADLLAWDDACANPGMFDVCVLRSCWNYYSRHTEFLDWIASADAVTTLLNSAAVVRWNLHKRYLRELADAGVPCIPTAWFERGRDADLVESMQTRGWRDVVIKPTISAASFRTRRFQIDDAEAGQGFLTSLVRDVDTMVQRYMPSVETSGERALVWIDGQVTHAVVKSPRFAGGVEQVSAAVAATAAEVAFAERVLATFGEAVLYARVDIVDDESGALFLSELELIEPSLYFLQCPAALERFVASIRRTVAASK
ncbi:MAG: hypothetical protein K8T91_15860 [Planctomycetes bacterium]|nr:hypothetical protein [Planctomycetota bacterium]